MTKVTLKLDLLTCDACIRSVKGILNSLDNVTEAEVDLTQALVTVNKNDDNSIQELITAIMDIGYEAQIA
jgi:copper chaperone CopZ